MRLCLHAITQLKDRLNLNTSNFDNYVKGWDGCTLPCDRGVHQGIVYFYDWDQITISLGTGE